jgi:hypothetical protein
MDTTDRRAEYDDVADKYSDWIEPWNEQLSRHSAGPVVDLSVRHLDRAAEHHDTDTGVKFRIE